MTPHDLELKRYNHIVDRLELIHSILNKIMNDKVHSKDHKLMSFAIQPCVVFLADVKETFLKYSEGSHV